nr:DNA methyltransferase [Clostridioides sp.]
MNIDEIKNGIKKIDWDFKSKSNKRDIHYIHPYPAKFIGDIPRNLIEIIGLPEDTYILDPFCGSGTTLVEAQKKGIPAIGIDLNPIACLLSKVKTSKLNPNFLECANECVSLAKVRNQVEKRDIKNVDHWFKEEIQVAVQSILDEIDKEKDQSINDALSLCLSSILVKVSNQDSDTRYAAVSKNISKEDVYRLFLDACKNLNKAKRDENINSNVKVINKNILKVSKEDIENKIGLVITSPPYPNAYEYWLYHKYRMWWLGYDAEEVKEQEIGARAHYFKKNCQTPEDFKNQMRSLFDLMDSVVVSNGHVCVIIGRSIIKGEVIDNSKLIEDVADEVGFLKVTNIERIIASNRKSFNLAHASIKKENILVFRKK